MKPTTGLWCELCGATKERCACKLSSIATKQPTFEAYEKIVRERMPSMWIASDAAERRNLVHAYIRDANNECVTATEPVYLKAPARSHFKVTLFHKRNIVHEFIMTEASVDAVRNVLQKA